MNLEGAAFLPLVLFCPLARRPSIVRVYVAQVGRAGKQGGFGRMRSQGTGYSGFGRKEGFVIKTCIAVLFITQKTGSNPNHPPLGLAWQIRGGGDGDAGPRDTWGGRAPWRQEPRAWGEPNIMQFAHSHRNYGALQACAPSEVSGHGQAANSQGDSSASVAVALRMRAHGHLFANEDTGL